MAHVKFNKFGNRPKAYLKNDAGLTLVIGNSKLANNVAIFNLPPGTKTTKNPCGTCFYDCKGCYAQKSWRMFKQVRANLTNNFILTLQANFAGEMIKLIKLAIDKYKIDTVRIHASGDFYSLAYALQWEKIIASFPGITFYAYTKSQFSPKNCHISKSILPCGGFNFGSLDYVRAKAREFKLAICPVTMLEVKGKLTGEKICGKNCKLCHVKEFVLFVVH